MIRIHLNFISLQTLLILSNKKSMMFDYVNADLQTAHDNFIKLEVDYVNIKKELVAKK